LIYSKNYFSTKLIYLLPYKCLNEILDVVIMIPKKYIHYSFVGVILEEQNSTIHFPNQFTVNNNNALESFIDYKISHNGKNYRAVFVGGLNQEEDINSSKSLEKLMQLVSDKSLVGWDLNNILSSVKFCECNPNVLNLRPSKINISKEEKLYEQFVINECYFNNIKKQVEQQSENELCKKEVASMNFSLITWPDYEHRISTGFELRNLSKIPLIIVNGLTMPKKEHDAIVKTVLDLTKNPKNIHWITDWIQPISPLLKRMLAQKSKKLKRPYE
jgi:hypothetical protein